MKNFILSFILLFAWSYSVAQQVERQNFKIMWYNVENYFDCVNDSLTDDSEFLPGGMRGWNYNKYLTKQAHISKVITAIGGWEAPALVGMCEVES
ncbi:MAG TPA: endonuclease, partial [Paludibacter sp.]